MSSNLQIHRAKWSLLLPTLCVATIKFSSFVNLRNPSPFHKAGQGNLERGKCRRSSFEDVRNPKEITFDVRFVAISEGLHA
jgi:hypothetical protein